MEGITRNDRAGFKKASSSLALDERAGERPDAPILTLGSNP